MMWSYLHRAGENSIPPQWPHFNYVKCFCCQDTSMKTGRDAMKIFGVQTVG